MIDKEALQRFVESRLEGTDYFLVDLSVSPANEIKVEIDSMGPIDIDYCVELSREIEEAFPRDSEDYELEVGSAGLTSPFKVRRQYEKHIGRDIEVRTKKGEIVRGTLRRVEEGGIALDTRVKVRPEGAKRPVEQTVSREIPFDEIREASYLLVF